MKQILLFLTLGIGLYAQAVPETKQPDWILRPPDPPLFVGVSGQFSSEQEARHSAERDAAHRIAAYYGGFYISQKYTQSSTYQQDKETVQINRKKIESYLESYTDQWISHIRVIAYHIEPKQVYVLVQITEEAAEKLQRSADRRTWGHAAAVFKSSDLSPEEQDRLLEALQTGLQNAKIPLHLVREDQPDAFEIVLRSQAPDYPVDNRRRYTVTMGFVRRGILLYTVNESFVEISRQTALYRIERFIKESAPFYHQVYLKLLF